MFSGIIQKTQPIVSVEISGKIHRVRIKKPVAWKLELGESVAIDGICSTVVARTPASFDVEYMPETLSKTTAARFTRGTLVNLERSLAYGDRVGGHFLQGHVDAVARIAKIDIKGRSREMTIALAATLSRFAAARGSVAINGVSLTIAQKNGRHIKIALIPHTLLHTNLGRLKTGDGVNIEVDLLARYGFVPRGATVRGNAKRRSGQKK